MSDSITISVAEFDAITNGLEATIETLRAVVKSRDDGCDAMEANLREARQRILELEAQLRAYTEPVSWLNSSRFIPKHAASCRDLNCDRRCMTKEPQF